jgi:hypothetical protein
MLKYGITIFVIATGFLLPARAQVGACPSSPAWKANIHKQMDLLLTPPAEHDRASEQAMNLVLELKEHGCLHDASDKISNKVLEIYEADGEDAHRIMAAVVLDGLGDERSLARMRELVGEIDSEIVRRVTLVLLEESAQP